MEMPERYTIDQARFIEERERIVHRGVDFTFCQMKEIVQAQKNNQRIEWEGVSPYVADYDMHTGEIWRDKLVKADMIGIALGKMLREKFPEARMVSIYDDYNTNLPDSSLWNGAPTKQIDGKDAPQLKLPDEVRANFRLNEEKLLREEGVIKKDDVEGKNYLLISETEQIQAAGELVKKLERINRIVRNGEAIYFVEMSETERSEDKINGLIRSLERGELKGTEKYQVIPLRTKSGRWLCEALDASSFIKPENLEITHLVILPKEFEEQQNKVWEILKTLGIQPNHYHNIFYDAKSVSPETAVQVVQEEIETYQNLR